MRIRKLLVYVNILLLLVIFDCQKQTGTIPERIGNWRVTVGPAGNEFYQPPVEKNVAPPSQQLLNIVKMIAPEGKEIEKWRAIRDSIYFIRASGDDEEYDFIIYSNGKLIELEYDNAQDQEERPDRMVLKGSKRSIKYRQIPPRARNLLSRLHPAMQAPQCWLVDTPVGKRSVVQVGELAYFIRGDGQIQAAGLINRGAMKEIDPEAQRPSSPEDVQNHAREAFAPYRDKFGVQKQLQLLSQCSPNPDGSFRFVIIGDSRSNNDLWSQITKHIDMIEPKPLFAINTGDIVPHGYVDEYLNYYIPVLKDIDVPFFVALGNHDDGDSGLAIEYRELFGPNSLNYYFDFGSIRFIIMDNCTRVQPYDSTLQWLEQTLASTPEGHRIVMCAHKPISNIEKWAYHAWDDVHSKVFADLMEKYQVAEVFFGHIHAYSTATLNGIHYTIAGGGGAGLHDRYGPDGNVHHYIICDVAPDGSIRQQVVRFYRVDE